LTKPVAVYLQDRLQGDWTHDSRVALVLDEIGFEVHAVTGECVAPWKSLQVWEEPSRFSAIRRIARLSPHVLFCEGGAWHLYALPFARHTWVRSPTRSSSPTKDLVQRVLLKRADAVSICNPWERTRWQDYRLVNLPYPLDTGFWSLRVERDPNFWTRRNLATPPGPLIVCVGSIISGKRPVQLFEGLAPFLQERDGATLLFAGETFQVEVEAELRSKVSQAGLEDRVHLPGAFRPREELRQLLAWADVHVLNTVAETQCMALYESLAAGVPTLIPAIPHLTLAFPNLPAHANVEELRRNVAAVLDNPSLGSELVESSQAYLKWADNSAHDRTVMEVCSAWLTDAEDRGRRRHFAPKGRGR
jgi:glycosyltransferase involved in cell wall biosynthesis